MECHQLELFLAVMEYSSVTRAAEKAHLSPGAISLQMHNLAQSLRTDLFVRSGKRLIPTPAALRLADHAKHLVRRMRELEGQFKEDPSSDVSPVRLATGATTLIHSLGAPLRRLRREFSNASIQVTVSATEEMVAGLLSGRFDLAIISLPFVDENLTVMPLFDEELLVLRPSAKRVDSWHVATIRPSELATARFMLYPRTSNMRTIINGFFRQIGVEPQVITEADDTEAIKRLVESGLGYSILPEYALRTKPRFFQTFRVPGHPLIRTQALAMVRSEHPRALVLEIAQFLKAALSAGEASLPRQTGKTE